MPADPTAYRRAGLIDPERYLTTRPATRHVSPPGLPPQPTWEPKRTGVRAALARLLDVLMGRPG